MCQHREPGLTTEGFLVWETHPIPSLGFPESPGECCRQGRAVSSPRVVLTSPIKLRQLCKPWASELGCNQLQSSARPRCTPRAPRSCRTKDFFQHPRKTMKNNLQLIQSPPWLPPTIPAWECLPGASWKRKARAAEQAVQELGMDGSWILLGSSLWGLHTDIPWQFPWAPGLGLLPTLGAKLSFAALL